MSAATRRTPWSVTTRTWFTMLLGFNAIIHGCDALRAYSQLVYTGDYHCVIKRPSGSLESCTESSATATNPVLDLSGRTITSIEPGAFTLLRLGIPTTLNLNNNLIAVIKADTFRGLPHVSKLILTGNPIVTITHSFVEQLSPMCAVFLSNSEGVICGTEVTASTPLTCSGCTGSLVFEDSCGEFRCLQPGATSKKCSPVPITTPPPTTSLSPSPAPPMSPTISTTLSPTLAVDTDAAREGERTTDILGQHKCKIIRDAGECGVFMAECSATCGFPQSPTISPTRKPSCVDTLDQVADVLSQSQCEFISKAGQCATFALQCSQTCCVAHGQSRILSDASIQPPPSTQPQIATAKMGKATNIGKQVETLNVKKSKSVAKKSTKGGKGVQNAVVDDSDQGKGKEKKWSQDKAQATGTGGNDVASASTDSGIASSTTILIPIVAATVVVILAVGAALYIRHTANKETMEMDMEI